MKSKNSHLRPVKTMTTIRQTIGLGADGVPFAKVATTMRSVRALRVQEVGKATTTIRSHEMVDEIVAVVADVVGIETRKIEIIAMIVGLETMSPLLHVQNAIRDPTIGKTINPTPIIAVDVAEGHADVGVVEAASVLNVKPRIQVNLMTNSSMTTKN